MAAPDETGGSYRWQTSAIAFGFVWIAGIVLSLVTFRLAISGRLWDLGFPSWLITLSVLVGVWQWIWIAPMLRFARRRNRNDLYNGLLRGGVSFSIVQIAIFVVLYFTFRRINLQ
jgi:hypothetical protein